MTFNFIVGLFFVFFSISSKHEEHNKCPFLAQKVFVDLSISFLQIKHLNIGDILKNILEFMNQLSNSKCIKYVLDKSLNRHKIQ